MADWQNKPFVVEVKANETETFCMCGLSQNAPLCDGSHKTTDITPKIERFDAAKKLYICGCQQSEKRPYCDGTHKSIV